MNDKLICPECGNDYIQYLTMIEVGDDSYKCLNCNNSWGLGIDFTSSSPKYPEIEVQLSGGEGNAFSILGNVVRAMKKALVPAKEISQFKEEAMSGDYDNLLQTCMKWVTIL